MIVQANDSRGPRRRIEVGIETFMSALDLSEGTLDFLRVMERRTGMTKAEIISRWVEMMADEYRKQE